MRFTCNASPFETSYISTNDRFAALQVVLLA